MSPRPVSAPEAGVIVARNPKARHDYRILDKWEAGLALTGSEIKSVRAGKVSLKQAFGVVRGGEGLDRSNARVAVRVRGICQS